MENASVWGSSSHVVVRGHLQLYRVGTGAAVYIVYIGESAILETGLRFWNTKGPSHSPLG